MGKPRKTKTKKFTASAGSFVLKEAVPRMVESRIHHGGKAACGGGNALASGEIRKTAKSVAGWMQRLGWSGKVGDIIKAQLMEMPLSGNPEVHAKKLHDYYQKHGVSQQRIVLENLETGEQKVAFQTGKTADWHGPNVDRAACADARHEVESRGRTQEAQRPENFYFGKEPVGKRSYNKVFTIAGVSPEYINGLLRKAERGAALTPWEKHNLAAVAVSAYYYSVHKWKNYEALEKMFRKK